jgi:FkbM family methyltransferase
MGIRHKLIRFIEQPSGIKDLISGVRPIHTYYFHNVKKFTDSIKTYIDIGANQGKLIEACRLVFPESYVYAIEPIKKHYHSLEKFSNITIFNCGLWNENTTKTFYHTKKDDYESSLLKPTMLDDNDIGTDIEELTIPVRRFDTLSIDIKSPCFVKLDVEGAEANVLEGMGDKLDEVDFVQLEQIHVKKNEHENIMSRCVKILEDHGFTGFIQIGTTYYPNGLPSKSDLLFFKEDMSNKPWFKKDG